MNTVEQLQQAIEAMGYALNALDSIGAVATAAQLDLTLHTLQEELRQEQWRKVLAMDYSAMDAMIESIYNSGGVTVGQTIDKAIEG